ncbi:endoglucanase 4 [Aplysia californica]|uniref:cellulase n=1 Tax=Aplysia californica TaxID=6500 RepID=A0ABM0JR73_APLCA|nr:endoglucanase 4 [Aplysia californica]
MALEDGLPVFLLHLLLFEHTLAFLDIRPFIRPNITIVAPDHNFWPWVPLQAPPPFKAHKGKVKVKDKGRRKRPYFRVPAHDFWPFVPIDIPDATKENLTGGYYQIPSHNFWPFIPIVDNTPKPVTTKPKPKKPSTTTPLPKPWPPSAQKYNYGEVMYKSIRFFEVQRSGWLPDDRKILWRDHSALDDRGDDWEDLTGGWYDSGDYVKFGLPMAAASTMLLWGLVEFPDAYRSAGLLDDMRDCVRWPLDYFIKAHTKKYEFYAQVGDPYLDHTYWGRPEDMDMDRPAYKLTPDSPGSDVAAETAASLAAGYLAFKDVDPPFAKKMLEHAQELFEFAENFRGSYSDSIESAAEFYESSSDEDELAWAAVWLYRATRERHYRARADYWLERAEGCWAQSWADKSCAVPY